MSKGSVSHAFKKFLYVTLFATFLAGCGPRQHTALKAPEPAAWCRRTINGLSLTATPCAVNKRLKGLLNGYQVLNIVVENKTQNSFILSGRDISLPLVSGKSIQKRVGSFKALYQAPALALGTIGLIFMWQLCLPAILASAVGYQWSSVKIQRHAHPVTSLIFGPTDQCIIEPQKTMVCKIAIKGDYIPTFWLILRHIKDLTPTVFLVRPPLI